MTIAKILLALVLVAILAAAGFSYWIYNGVNSPHEHARSNDYIKIEKGTTPNNIIAKLADEGVIANATPTTMYMRLFGDTSKLQAGEFQFPSPITPLQVLKVLERGEDRTVKFTVPEGFTRFDIAKRIAEKFSQADPIDDKAVVAMMDDVSLIRDISPDAPNLEGYMYPNTYSLPPDATPKEVIKAMVEQFKKVWKPEWNDAAKALNRTPHEIITMASLIETETSVESERPIVAGVINNRLARNIPLGIDQANVYLAKMMGRWDGTIHKSDLEVNSPYNTRIKTGLPPGPISSVTESSIKAALDPSPNSYIFYVRNVDLNDGSHWFYESAADFEKGKAKYQQWLEKERQLERQSQANQQAQ